VFIFILILTFEQYVFESVGMTIRPRKEALRNERGNKEVSSLHKLIDKTTMSAADKRRIKLLVKKKKLKSYPEEK